MHRCHRIFFGKMLFHTLFQAKEVAIMTGVALRLQVRDEYYDSVECGHAKEEPYKVLFLIMQNKICIYIFHKESNFCLSVFTGSLIF